MLRALVSRFAPKERAPGGVFSDDSQRAAQGMLNDLLGGGQTNPPERTVQSYLEAYSTMPWLHAVANKVATSVAQVEWSLWVAQRAGTQRAIRHHGLQHMPHAERETALYRMKQSGELREIESHPLLDALSFGNALDVGLSVRKTTQLHLDLVGEAFWLKDRGTVGQPAAFWPIPPHWVRDTPSPGRPMYRFSYKGVQKNIPDEDVLWFKMTDPANPYQRGKGTARSLGDELETDEYAAKMLRQFFYNRAEPQFILMPDGANGIDDAEVKRLERRWSRRAQGFWKYMRPLFTGQKMKVHEFKRDFRNMQLTELRSAERNMIIQVWGVPPELLGVIENSNRATIDAAAYLFSRWVTLPRLEFLRSVLQERLVPEYDERLILSFTNPVEHDRDFQLKVYAANPVAFDVDEWRALADHEPLTETEGGAMRWKPNTGSLVEEIADAVDGGADEDEEDDDTPPSGGVEEELAAEYTLKAFGDPSDLSTGARIASQREAALARDVLEVVTDAQQAVTIATLAGRIAKKQPAEAVMKETLLKLDDLATPVGEHVVDGYIASARSEIAALKLETEKALSQAELRRQADRWAKRHAVGLTRRRVIGEQRDAIRSIRDIGVRRGWTPRTIALRMRDSVGLTRQQAEQVARFYIRQLDEGVRDSWAQSRAKKLATSLRRARAETIARTSMVEAVQEGKQQLWANAIADGQLKRTVKQRWRVQDSGADPQCLVLDGMERRVGGTFNGVEHPPLHPRCRCDLELVVS